MRAAQPLLAPFDQVADRTAEAYGLDGMVVVALDSCGGLRLSVSHPTRRGDNSTLAAALEVAAHELRHGRAAIAPERGVTPSGVHTHAGRADPFPLNVVPLPVR